MTPEEHYKEVVKLDMDKFDKKMPKFDYYDLLDFADSYYKKQLTLTDVVDKLKDRNDELSELSKDLIRKVEKKIPYISLPEDEGLYTALHKLKNEAYKSL
tara:strand:+ start:102 stop:401 length:300 start_codon:yes stop_codon:yes gene_type:complete